MSSLHNPSNHAQETLEHSMVVRPTIFTDPITKVVKYGVRVENEEWQVYMDHWDDMPDDDLEILARVMDENTREIEEMLWYVQLTCTGIGIGNKIYSYDDVCQLFGNSLNI